MKRIGVLTVVILLIMTVGFVGTAAASESASSPECSEVSYSGSGTDADPYQVDTLDRLQCIGSDHANASDLDDALGSDYELTDDIDASETEQWEGNISETESFEWPYDADTEEFDLHFTPINEDSVEVRENDPYGPGAELNFTIENATEGTVKVEEEPSDRILEISYTAFIELGFDPIGDTNNPFTGSFDGNGHTINGLVINGNNNVGLFGYVGDARIENANLESADITGFSNDGGSVGGLIGEVSFDGADVLNSSVTGTVTSESTARHEASVGGLIGQTMGGNVSDTSTDVTVEGEYSAGGLIGDAYNEKVERSISTGDVTTEGRSARDTRAGGIIGLSQTIVTQSTATGDVTAEGDYAGGLVGNNQPDGEIHDSYATGDVTGESFVGGLVGMNWNITDSSFASGAVTGDSDVGGVVGDNNDDGEVGDLYWNTESTGQTDAVGTNDGDTSGDLVGLGTAEMQGSAAAENMDILDFDQTWQTVTAPDDYPQLQWQEDPISLTYSDLVVTPTDLKLNEEITANATLTSEEDSEESYEATLKVDGSVVDSEEGTLSGGESTEVGFTHTMDTGGDVDVTIGDLDPETVTVALYDGGDGSADNPYEIATWDHLDRVRDNLDANFTVVNDLNESTEGYDEVANETANSGDGFEPIGTDENSYFSGSFDGENHTIDGVTIDREGDNRIGLFGTIDGGTVIEHVHLESVDITGGSKVGGLVGWSHSDSSDEIRRVHVDGSVNAAGDAGGLIGSNWQNMTISEVSANVAVTSTEGSVGGLVGWGDKATITNVYALGDVSGGDRVGGLIGQHGKGRLEQSYAAGKVSDGDSEGGLIGKNAATVEDSYWDTERTEQSTSAGDETGLSTEQMTGDDALDNMGGLAADSWETITLDTAGANGDGYPTLSALDREQQILVPDGFEALFAGGDGTVDDPYQIEDWHHLNNTREYLDANFTVNNDLTENTAGYDQIASESANDGDGFEPIGENPDQFSGSFNGSGYTISDLYINRTEDDIGLFGRVHDEGTINNVRAENVSIDGDSRVGGLVGNNQGILSNSSATGSVIGSREFVGGLVGYNDDGTVHESSATTSVTSSSWYVGGLVGINNFGGTVTKSYATGSVKGSDDVGGLVGRNINSGSNVSESYATGSIKGSDDVGGLVGENRAEIHESYARGTVNGSAHVGGFVGLNADKITTSFATGYVNSTGTAIGGLVGFNDGGSVDNAYWDTESTNQSDSDGNATGLTTAQMTGSDAPAEMAGFAFTDVWVATEGYPTLTWNGSDPFFAVEIDSTTEPVDAGDTLDVTANVTNWGVDAEQTVNLTDTGFTNSQQDALDVDLNSSESDDSVDLQWDTGSDDDGTDDITVSTPNESDTESVTIEDTGGSGNNNGGGSTSGGSTSGGSTSGGSTGGGGGDDSSDSSETSVTVGDDSDDESDDDSDDAESGDNGDSGESRPDTSVSVSNPQPGQRLVIEGGEARIEDSNDEGGENDDEEGGDKGDDTEDGDGEDGDSGDGDGESTSNVRSDSLSVDINTDRNFDLSITTYEGDLSRSISSGDDSQSSLGPRFASGAALVRTQAQTQSPDAEVIGPDKVREASAAFENDTGIVSAGYVDIEHTLEPGEMSGATFEFSVRKSYLDELGVDADDVELHHRKDGEWQTRETEHLGSDETHHRFKGTMTDFSVFALGTGAPPIGVTDASLAASTVDSGEEATISATIENRGQGDAEETVDLTVDGETVDSKSVSLEGGETTDIDFGYTPEEIGEYAFAVGGTDAGSLTVGDGVGSDDEGQSWGWLVAVILVTILVVVILWRRQTE